MSIAAHHAEWLSLMDVSGPFLSVGVLTQALPNGLDGHEPTVAAELRAAHDAWVDPESAGYGELETAALHRAFIKFVLERLLGFDQSVLLNDAATLERFTVAVPTHNATLSPDFVLIEGETPQLLVTVLPPKSSVDLPVPGDTWTATPRERMVELLKGKGCPLGLVTDGERWCLVTWREGQVPGFATWFASLWREERITLQSFRTLLGARRFFTGAEDDTLPRLLERSAQDQSEITTKLGHQTLEAVEVLVRTIDRLDRDRGGALLAAVEDSELYDAAVTVMMRLIFLFFAEENDLLPIGEPLYDQEYAASSLRAWLQERADRDGEEVLETTSDAWPRLLATWRAVFGGVEHGEMRLTPYGGSLFDPDRYPFLEGRLPGSSWQEVAADPLPIDNRTVLHLLNALQTLKEQGQRNRLSFRALDVEQIGHVYEGMLDHTATRSDDWVLGLSGTGGREPEVSLAELEALDPDELVRFLKEKTGRNAPTIDSWLAVDAEEFAQSQFGNLWAPAFGGDVDASARAIRFARFIRTDSAGGPTVFSPRSVYVCDSSHRGATGTHYTPRALTIEMVADTLGPLVYVGPSEGLPESEWTLRSPEEILALKVCDPACGSGAFLVQACRYLAGKLVESRQAVTEEVPPNPEEARIEAHREVAGRCLYGVDVNAMAVEMAKLSIWLITLSRDKPFSFIDHAVRVGDSLIGVTDLGQIRHWSLGGSGEQRDFKEDLSANEVAKAVELRQRLEQFPALDTSDVAVKLTLLRKADAATARVRALGDLLVAPELRGGNAAQKQQARDEAWIAATRLLGDAGALKKRASELLGTHRPFHWALEFPEVFREGGFDGIIGNPPFLGGKKLTGAFGVPYREYLVCHVGFGVRGSADLAAYFFLRSFALIRPRGNFGLLAVNTIAEGDTRQVGLEQLLHRGGSVYSAYPNEPWPNAAAVITSRVHVHKGEWKGARKRAGISVDWISAYLTEADDWSPTTLPQNAGIAFVGSYLNGKGFVIDHARAEQLINEDPRNRDVVLPYLVGNDLTNAPGQRASRWAICFWDWDIERATQYSGPFAIVERDVKPQRQELRVDGSFKQRNPLPQLWWVYADKRPALYHAIGRGRLFAQHQEGWNSGDAPLPMVIVCSIVAKYLMFVMVPNNQLFAHRLAVFASCDFALLALLSSSVHESWARHQSSTLATAMNYSPADAFESFPIPATALSHSALSSLGRRFSELRETLTARANIGMTDLYNQVHDAGIVESDIVALRVLVADVDRAVLELYGWTDIVCDHGFYDVPSFTEGDRRRFTIAEDARREILKRLKLLNREGGHNEQRDHTGNKTSPSTEEFMGNRHVGEISSTTMPEMKVALDMFADGEVEDE